MRKRREWLRIVMVVLILGLSYAAYSLFMHTGTDYLTVSELKSKAESLHSQQVWVGGRVVAGSINWDDSEKILRFALSDDKESLSIAYNGIVPDNFKPGDDLIVGGKYYLDSDFEALSFSRPRSVCNICH